MSIGWFLHTPFATSEMYRTLPHRDEILRGVLGADLVGFHIYDLGFQSQNSEAAKPMVYTTTLLLIAIIATLNLTAIWLRTRLNRKFVANQF